MTEQYNENEHVEEQTQARPRRPDGTFMSKSEIERLQKESKTAFDAITENNKALMHGTPFNIDYFKGMNPQQINKFLLNYHDKKQEAEPERDHEPNTPILGTPIGSGKPKYFIDKFLDINPKERTIEFVAPASIVFGKHKNNEEATNKWLDRL